ncbi:hypothetical protein GCM10011297_03200 [Bacterioplanes sanyensis]|nr:hypothetical protein GCM10011297_03200 [Bacterioplanes sanyensis]
MFKSDKQRRTLPVGLPVFSQDGSLSDKTINRFVCARLGFEAWMEGKDFVQEEV